MLVNLNEVLKPAQRGKYAVGLFNAVNLELARGIIAAAEQTGSPVIMGTAEVLLPYGELSLISPSVIAAAKAAKVPVVVHYDHGLTVERCKQALDLGFTSIMFDGSAGDTAENLKTTAEMVKLAHSMGVTVEGEIGHVGDAVTDDGATDDMYTTPKEAVDFVAATGVDALAVAIGTAHGVYRTKPKLDLDRLAEIRAAIDTPLVLHGGSGLSDDDFRNAIAGGIAKVNIFTDLCRAGLSAIHGNPDADYLIARAKKVEAIKQETMKKMMLFGCNGKA